MSQSARRTLIRCNLSEWISPIAPSSIPPSTTVRRATRTTLDVLRPEGAKSRSLQLPLGVRARSASVGSAELPPGPPHSPLPFASLDRSSPFGPRDPARRGETARATGRDSGGTPPAIIKRAARRGGQSCRRGLYCMASARWCVLISGARSKSAMVRANLTLRSPASLMAGRFSVRVEGAGSCPTGTWPYAALPNPASLMAGLRRWRDLRAPRCAQDAAQPRRAGPRGRLLPASSRRQLAIQCFEGASCLLEASRLLNPECQRASLPLACSKNR